MIKQIKDSGIQFHPKKGCILICDFKGNILPEIVKKRPVVVVANQLQYRPRLAFIVPLSNTPPQNDVKYAVRLSHDYLSNDDTPMWAKCDLLCSVSFSRLDRIKTGYRKYATPTMSEEDFQKVLQGLHHIFNFIS
jgi:uncharacterized protein YifN (PemK superfamily)